MMTLLPPHYCMMHFTKSRWCPFFAKSHFATSSSSQQPFFLMRPLFFTLDLEGGKFFFNTVREGDSVLFATEDEGDASNWVMAFYRATGQAHKPQPPTSTGKSSILASGNGKLYLVVHKPPPCSSAVHVLDQPIHVPDQPD